MKLFSLILDKEKLLDIIQCRFLFAARQSASLPLLVHRAVSLIYWLLNEPDPEKGKIGVITEKQKSGFTIKTSQGRKTC